MIFINKNLAIAVLTLVVGVGCSDNNTVNSIPQETQAATQLSNPVTLEEQNTGTQTNSDQQPVAFKNSLQKQPVAASNSTNRDNLQANSYQQPVKAKVDYLKPVNDTFIIPGKRVGLITGETTRADLVELYGETNLKDDVVLQAEGTVSVPVTKVNPGTPGALTIFWKDKSRNKILYIKGFGRQWKTLEGLGPGTSLEALREVLGEFKLTGFGWDYGGLVNLEGTKLSKYKGKLSLTLNPSDDNAYGKYPKQYAAVSGDRELSSSNPNLEPLDVRIYAMTVNFGE
ncbi:MAG: hypothetical protein WBA07_24720 [Rivularia sp. (in: cyanobacteria)]